jgi:hypothetical protein
MCEFTERSQISAEIVRDIVQQAGRILAEKGIAMSREFRTADDQSPNARPFAACR